MLTELPNIREHGTRYRDVTLQHLDMLSDEQLGCVRNRNCSVAGPFVHILQTEKYYSRRQNTMSFRALVTAATLYALVSVPAAPAFGQTPSTETPPASIGRIQEALERPDMLNLRPPDFSITVIKKLDFGYQFDVTSPRKRPPGWLSLFTTGAGRQYGGAIGLAFASVASMAGDGGMSARPLIAIDGLAAAVIVAGKVKTVMDHRKLGKTHESVRRELEEFCAANGCKVPPDF